MSAGPGQSSAPSKLTGTSSQPVSYPQSQSQSYSFGPDAASRRVSGPLVGGQSSSNLASARNNQSKKANHKRQRKPRLIDEDAIAEATAMRSTSTRKGQTSITHLMNFSLPPRPHSSLFRPHRNVTYHSGYHRVDKARYVNANYRFIVNPTKSYHAQATNADVHLDWDTVLQVLVSTSSQPTSCPICLCVPVAPRMAKCGHIFCLPCVIRFIQTVDDPNSAPIKKARWKKCPICWDPVYMSETRCVRWYSGQQIDTLMEGGDVFLRLVMRRPGSTLALPRDGADRHGHAPDDDLPWYNAAEVTDYARFMKGGEDYMMSQYDAELEALEKQEQEDELLFGQDSTWTQKAMTAIREAKEKIKGIGNPPSFHRHVADGQKHEQDPSTAVGLHASEGLDTLAPGNLSTEPPSNSIQDTALSTNTSLPGEDEAISSTMSKLEIQPQPAIKQALSEEKPLPPSINESERAHPPDIPYYFYQALPHFYLSSLDIRILKSAFGDFSLFPSTILPRVEHISTGHIMDDDLRKRVKYLSHLPYGCELTFLECDWTDLVSPSVLEKFSADIERRRKRNREKATREEKERIRAEREEDEKRLAPSRRKRLSLSSPSERPFSASDFQPLGSLTNEDHVDTSVSTASPPWSSTQNRNHQSFAALATPSNSPPSRRTVWGTAIVESSSPAAGSSQGAFPPNHDDGWLQDWEAELLAEQQEYIINGANNSGSSGKNKNTPGATPGKKKKNKKITLMSTNARRAA
ncbi:putative Delta(24(24(1)))-sterol reductase [Microsporum canis]|uniref:RING finger domain-containing protein n=1 Tax=Arthroderma otae (strain ATCC MYA-4605 / CBS 113480) TaxID=554155 RepID=C5FRM2_ARTOC|nr:RING finger domain-containing protein [Microsporum canis CBS 113480]EEQ32525.1 RING finger domain-containing protein [Microsporum canis CBS 113480]